MGDEPVDPKSNVIAFKRAKRSASLEPVYAGYGACRHERATVSEEKRSVECSSCKTQLDALTVLLELARRQRRWLDELDAWDEYRESKLAERYDKEWERDRDHVNEPPTEPALRRIWDTFHEHLADKFCGMYRRKRRLRSGVEWYGKTIDGGLYSYEYVRNQLVPKLTVGGKASKKPAS